MPLNIALPLSASITGMPISIDALSSPGTLIHTSENEKDFVWLWLSLVMPIGLAVKANVMLVKGSPGTGFQEDSLIYLKPGVKTLVESGGLLYNNLRLYAYIHSSSGNSVNAGFIKATGYVHRRVE